jgi:hypothetical protein
MNRRAWNFKGFGCKERRPEREEKGMKTKDGFGDNIMIRILGKI